MTKQYIQLFTALGVVPVSHSIVFCCRSSTHDSTHTLAVGLAGLHSTTQDTASRSRHTSFATHRTNTHTIARNPLHLTTLADLTSFRSSNFNVKTLAPPLSVCALARPHLQRLRTRTSAQQLLTSLTRTRTHHHKRLALLVSSPHTTIRAPSPHPFLSFFTTQTCVELLWCRYLSRKKEETTQNSGACVQELPPPPPPGRGSLLGPTRGRTSRRARASFCSTCCCWSWPTRRGNSPQTNRRR